MTFFDVPVDCCYTMAAKKIVYGTTTKKKKKKKRKKEEKTRIFNLAGARGLQIQLSCKIMRKYAVSCTTY